MAEPLQIDPTKFHVAITGHRPAKLGPAFYYPDSKESKRLSDKIKDTLLSVMEGMQGNSISFENTVLITGMALGVDTLFAKLAIELKIPFIAAIPCRGQHSMWPQKSKETYLDLIDHELCRKVYVSQGAYSPQKMQLRNEWMVDHCEVLIAVWDGTPGGTANCVRYAQKVNKPIIRIEP